MGSEKPYRVVHQPARKVWQILGPTGRGLEFDSPSEAANVCDELNAAHAAAKAERDAEVETIAAPARMILDLIDAMTNREGRVGFMANAIQVRELRAALAPAEVKP